MRTYFCLITWSMAATLTLFGVSGISGASPPCDLRGTTWKHQTDGVGPSTWKIDGNLIATEKGLGKAQNARVAVTMGPKGPILRIDWDLPKLNPPMAGYYEWMLDPQCKSGAGQLVFRLGRKTGPHPSRVSKLAAALPPGPPRDTVAVCRQWNVHLVDERPAHRVPPQPPKVWKGVWRRDQEGHLSFGAIWRSPSWDSPTEEIRGRVVYPIDDTPNLSFASDIPNEGVRVIYRGYRPLTTTGPQFDITGDWFVESTAHGRNKAGWWKAACR